MKIHFILGKQPKIFHTQKYSTFCGTYSENLYYTWYTVLVTCRHCIRKIRYLKLKKQDGKL